jgi:hypothetical protein
VKIGLAWMMTASDFEKWRAGEHRSSAPTVEDAAAELRRRGIIA